METENWKMDENDIEKIANGFAENTVRRQTCRYKKTVIANIINDFWYTIVSPEKDLF